jgi:pimeloyl-ACP methyl ester carboxylesterase
MTDPSSHFADANGLRLHYLRWGDDGPPVLLNHATGFLAVLWAPVAERLAAAGFTVYACDARGHGNSEKPDPMPENYHWRRMADDMLAFMEQLGLRGIPLVGHSMGAGVGLYVAGHNPGLFSRIVAIEPIVMPGGMTMDETRREAMAEGARRRRTVFASREEMAGQYRKRPTFERWTDEALGIYAEAGTFQREDGRFELKCSGAVEGEVFANSWTLDTWDVLPEITAPALLVRGEHTEPFLGTIARMVSERVQNGRLLTLPDAGHLAPMERPEAVAQEILAFIAPDRNAPTAFARA